MNKKQLKLREDIKQNYDKFDAAYFSKKYGVGLGHVYGIASSLKVTRRYHNSWEEYGNDMIKDYLDGVTLEKLGDKYNHFEGDIRNFLEENGITIRLKGSWQKLYQWDTTFFKRIDSHEKAYWLGFIYADGNVRIKDGNQGLFQIALAKRDFSHLKKLKESLKSNHKIYQDRDCRRIIISQREIYNDLIKLGVSENKSLTLIPPSENQVPKQFINSFLLGYFDGDGSIYYSKNRKRWGFNIIGTFEICNFFKDFLYEHGVEHLSMYKEKRLAKKTNVWYLATGGGLVRKESRDRIKIIYDALYKDSPVFMDRKRDKFLFCLKSNE